VLTSPASSRTSRTWRLGSTRPTEPMCVLASSGCNNVSVGEVSVRPYANIAWGVGQCDEQSGRWVVAP
jgi:hypothetical protein